MAVFKDGFRIDFHLTDHVLDNHVPLLLVLLGISLPTCLISMYHLVENNTWESTLIIHQSNTVGVLVSKIKDDEKNFLSDYRYIISDIRISISYIVVCVSWVEINYQVLLGEQWLSGDILFVFAHLSLAGNICIALDKIRSVFIY